MTDVEYTIEVFGEKGWEISASTEDRTTALTIFNLYVDRGEDVRLSSYSRLAEAC